MPSPTITPLLLTQAQEGQRDPLALAVQEVLRKALFARRVPAQEIEDLCQEKLPTILGKLLEGRVEPGKEDGYVWRCGETLAISFFRKNKGKFVPLEEEEIAAPSSSESVSRKEIALAKRVKLLREVLAGKTLSAAESQLLRDVYVSQIPIGDLAERELRQNPLIQRGPHAGATRTLEQARNSVDQRLTRARLKLTAELTRRIAEEQRRTWS